MKKLTDDQKEFLLEYFFKNEKYPGWKNIATKLLEHGEAIVPGDRCIWNGGIGNYIKTKDHPLAISCLLYCFDLEYFLDSAYFKGISNQYLTILNSKIRSIEKEYEDICNL